MGEKAEATEEIKAAAVAVDAPGKLTRAFTSEPYVDVDALQERFFLRADAM